MAFIYPNLVIFQYYNVLSKNKKTITIVHLKIIIFTAMKNRSISHGHVFVMYNTEATCRSAGLSLR